MSKSKEKGGRYLNLNQKLEVIQKLEKSNASSKRSSGRDHNVTERTIRKNIMKKNSRRDMLNVLKNTEKKSFKM